MLGFDVVRAVAALMVIWCHCGDSAAWRGARLEAIGGMGTAFLNLLAGFFLVHTFVKARETMSPWRFALKRVGRVYGAFAVWSVVYVAFRIGLEVVQHGRVGSAIMAAGAGGGAVRSLLLGTLLIAPVALFMLVGSGRSGVVALAAGEARPSGLRRALPLGVAGLVGLAGYCAYRVWAHAALGRTLLPDIDWSIVLHGTSPHLWFLPYLTLVTLLALPLVRHATGTPARAAAYAGLIGAVALAIIAGQYESELLPAEGMAGWTRIFGRAPGFMVGVSVGLWIASGRRMKPGVGVALVCGLVILGCAYLRLTTDIPQLWLNRVAALSAFVVASAPWAGRVAQWLGRLGQLGFGVYLCHMLVIVLARSTLELFGVGHSLLADLTVYALAVVGSFALAQSLRSRRSLAWLIP
jgi:peptidoglycan/LPS O-acetylase OafA/YrhL